MSPDDAWGAGDYRRIADQFLPAAQVLLDAVEATVGPLAGQHVVDVAAGNGNVAVEALARGATVLASDLSPRMVEFGRDRTHAAGDTVEWRVADAVALPLPDGATGIVTSAFGLIFVADPVAMVDEMARVLRPGGLLAFTSWRHEEGVDHPLAAPLMKRFPTSDGPSSDEWGVDDTVRERLAPAFVDLQITTHSLELVFDSAEHCTDVFLGSSPMHVIAMAEIPEEEHAAIRREFIAGLLPFESAQGLRHRDDYLVVTARRS
ncbi:MAG: methyltransferase domain-containing protein [Candidatus Nanopelagicales bacterium]